MKSRSYTKSINSSSVWTYQALQDSDERPRLVSFNNIGDYGIYIKWMNVDEANGTANDKYYLGPGNELIVEIESSELPVTRVGAKLYSGSDATTLIISTANFQDKNIS